ncbi:restriction endonuclease subunit S [uncultured Alistipes sp.]|uniref:restriction endonuclease subunit S n=2 Tax=Alistipes TaxID=239759 RepID=UPI00259574C2|nr:restriction endonuclease subunit S [uncultured Alistipes sp.]
MGEWKTYKLCEVANLSTGFPFNGHKYAKEGQRVVRGDNVTIGELRWDTDKDKRWNEPFARAEEFSLQEGDIVIGMDGSRVGRNRAQIKADDLPLLLAQRVACVRHNEKSLQKFLYYQIFSKNFENYIKSVHTGTSIPHVSLKQIGDFSFQVPDLSTQRRIAGILGSLDDKIELNRRINANLEAQAQALFRSWFVDFEPFRDGPFVDSELGKIPQGWKVGTASEFYKNITIGKTPPRKEHQWFSKDSHDIVWVSIADMGNCGLSICNSSEYLTPEAIKKFNICIVPVNTVLLSFKLTIGRVAIADKELATNEAIAHFQTQHNTLEYTYLALKNYEFSSLGSTSSIATAVNSKIIKSMPWMMPSDDVLNQFHNVLSPIFNGIRNNIQEITHLSALRDTLLPKLMAGEISC